VALEALGRFDLRRGWRRRLGERDGDQLLNGVDGPSKIDSKPGQQDEGERRLNEDDRGERV
jgi:hypothetical protein